jgi:hypothetical protein
LAGLVGFALYPEVGGWALAVLVAVLVALWLLRGLLRSLDDPD